MTATYHPIVLIGYGDIARRVAERLAARDIVAIARQRPQAPADHRGTWTGLAVDLDDEFRLPEAADLSGAIWVYLAPPPRQGSTDTRVTRWLESAGHTPTAVIYIGTTAVYGDQQGGWVDESTAPAPGHDRGRRRLDAERQFTEWCGARD
ncbi:MAG: SDR family NAD(P)-dependent oxidoreductase, partial [Pseudomonadota bacterium]